MVIIYISGSVGGFVLSSLAGEYFPRILFLQGSQLTVGASASISALVGAILAYGHRSGSSMARSYANSVVIQLVLIGFLMPAIDNYAHAGGFAAGYLAARLLDPLKPERIDHIAIALVCLAVSVLSVVVSVFAAFPTR
jgi:rhomboid protease GluP